MTSTAASIDWLSRAEALQPRVRNFVDGRWQEDRSENQIEKRSPRDGRLLCTFGAGEAQGAQDAVASARRAAEDGRWSNLPAQRRKDVLLKLAASMEQQREELALLECLDVGKPISDAVAFDVPVAIATIRAAAEGLDHVYGKVFGVDRSSLSYELRRPVGLVAGIVGWNFPLVLAATKLGPALATGNSLVLKPSEFTSLSAGRIAELAVDAGVPEGVFNVVHGNAAVGAALSLHRDVDLVTFTGSSATGKKLLIAAGQSNMKRLILECGGKAPSIVFDDCPNIEAVAQRVVARAFWNQGQVCTASSRLLIQESIKDEVLRKVIEKTAALKLGDPLNPQTRFGALVSREHRQKVQSYVDSGAKQGAQIVYQSASLPPFEGGFYVAPVIFDRVTPAQPIAQEEIFGPVLSVIAFRDEAEAIAIANNTIYGLSAIVWTKDVGRAHRVAQGIKAGWIVINATAEPAGGLSVGVKSSGGHKESGLGVEGGIDGLMAYTSHTAVQYFV